jgi:Bacterial regulatory proteins, gntR family
MTRHARTIELPLELAASGAPLRHRVADALIDLLRTGHLRPGDTLPATRVLAAELAISRTAVLAGVVLVSLLIPYRDGDAAYNLVMDVASGRLDTADDIAAILQEATESRT